MSTHFPNNQTLLERSVSRTFKLALEEWYFAHYIKDNGTPCMTCELCGHSNLRYQFLIKNRLNNQFMYVGSECVLKWDIEIKENGIKILGEKRKQLLDATVQDVRRKRCLQFLQKLVTQLDEPILKNALSFYDKNHYLTPKFAFVVLWKLKQNNIDHEPSFFKIYIRTKKCKQDLLDMEFSKVKVIAEALNSNQIEILPAWMRNKLKGN